MVAYDSAIAGFNNGVNSINQLASNGVSRNLNEIANQKVGMGIAIKAAEKNFELYAQGLGAEVKAIKAGSVYNNLVVTVASA